MGIFSSKKKTYVDTAVMRVVEDSQIPDSLLDATVTSIFTKKPVTKAILDANTQSTFRNFERMYRYAESGDYFYGLPNARVLSSDGAADQVKAAIEAEVGRTITMDYAYFRPINNIHVGWKILDEDYGYDPITNEITGLSQELEQIVYLEDMVAVHKLTAIEEAEANSVGTWGTNPKSGYTPERLAQEYTSVGSLVKEQSYRAGANEIDSVEIHYMWEVLGELDLVTGIRPPATIHRDMLVVSLASYDQDKEYHQARYTNNGVTHYWVYDPETGQHPELDGVFAANYTSPGTYFPFAVFRRERQNRATEALAETEEYTSTKKLLNYINMDFQEFSDSIHENPGIDQVDQAVLMMAVPMNTQEPVDIDYLMRFFTNLEANTSFTPINRISVLTSLSTGEATDYAIEIADADFRMVISYGNITRKIMPGSIGAIGTFSNALESEDTGGLSPITDRSMRVLRKQVTTGAYEEIRVYNAKSRYDIFADRSVTGSGDDDRVMVPLDYAITRQMRTFDREKLYYRSLHLVANSRVVKKVKWYESSLFRALLIIIAVVITIKTLGAAKGTLVAAYELGGAAAVKIALIKMVATAVVTSMLVPVVAQQLVKIVGPELAMVIATAALVYGGYKGFKAGGITQGSLADNLIKTASGIMQGTQRELSELFARFQSDVDDFEQLKEKMMGELDQAKSLLENNVNIDPLALIFNRPLVIAGESPTQYFNRTIHSGNVGIRAYQIIENFVEVSLTLPTIQDSIEDKSYV